MCSIGLIKVQNCQMETGTIENYLPEYVMQPNLHRLLIVPIAFLAVVPFYQVVTGFSRVLYRNWKICPLMCRWRMIRHR